MDSLVKDSQIDLLLTDPPYGINIVSSNGEVGATSSPLGFKGRVGGNVLGHSRRYRSIINDDKPFEPQFLLKYGIKQIIFGANNFATKLPDMPSWLVWDKKDGRGAEGTSYSDIELAWCNTNSKVSRIYRHLWSGLLREGDRKTELKDRVHPTQKPVGLLAEIIMDYSLENQTVLDPFLGSGSTLIACEQTNRICYGMELDPHYVDVIIRRWENYTGSKAVQINA
jgi:DNA modification methylase